MKVFTWLTSKFTKTNKIVKYKSLICEIRCTSTAIINLCFNVPSSQALDSSYQYAWGDGTVLVNCHRPILMDDRVLKIPICVWRLYHKYFIKISWEKGIELQTRPHQLYALCSIVIEILRYVGSSSIYVQNTVHSVISKLHVYDTSTLLLFKYLLVDKYFCIMVFCFRIYHHNDLW
jgi:hypothetical protein